MARLLPFLRRYTTEAAFALIALAFASGAMLLVPVAVRRVLDFGFASGNEGLIDQYFAVMFAVVAILAVASAVRFYFVSWIGERIVADLRDALFAHLLKLSPSFYEQQRTGEVVSRLTADASLIKSAFSSTASIALRNSVMLVGALAMMVYTSPKLAGLAALAIPSVIIPVIFYGRKVRNLSRAAQDALAQSAAFAQERLDAITTVQSNTQEPRTLSNFEASTDFAFNTTRKRNRARALLTAAIIFVSMGTIVILLWYGARDVMSGNMTGGTLSQFVLYAVFAASSLGQLSEVWGEVQSAAGAAERISELLDEQPDISSPAIVAQRPAPTRGKIAFRGVGFHYPSRPDRDVLKAMSFTANPDEVTAIVGPSGAGKTTIFALLQRFHDPQSGTITLDGQDIKSLDVEDLRNCFATVPQDPIIFSGTVADNIRFGQPMATDAEVQAAAEAAHVDEFVKTLPQGLATQLGERGVTLSGGQRQRVAIARAIVRNAPILLLDEATSALDAESEALVQKALQRLTKGKTTLVIAHRLATVRKSHNIIVLDKGKVQAQGTHADLIKSSQLYERLAKLQFNAAI